MADKKGLQFEFKQATPNLAHATITIPASLVSTLFDQAAQSQVNKTDIYGFPRGSTPVSYIKEHFKPKLINHLKEFFFKYGVMSCLYKNLNEQKVAIVGEPRLAEIYIEPDNDAVFLFNISLIEPITFCDWKLLPFKAPKRKNYKDIDRQVETFIKEEQDTAKKATSGVAIADWVLFTIRPVKTKQKPLLSDEGELLWLRVGDEEADILLRDLFLEKEVGEIFYTDHQSFQEYFSDELQTEYLFEVCIVDIVKNSKFCFDELKKHFRLKNNKEMHHKLIEVFSYRNDISQRRLMVEEVFKVLLAKHPFEVSNHFILRQEEHVFNSVHNNPDYHVYKNERSFKEYVKKLAAKQVQEVIIMDQLKHKENVAVNDFDVRCYLNLAKRARTKEFIYFEVPESKINGQEIPMPAELLRHIVQREKTLNFVIYHLLRDE